MEDTFRPIDIGLTAPFRETKTISFQLGKGRDKQASQDKMRRRLKELSEEGWRVESKVAGSKLCYVSLERWIHPARCACGRCPKLKEA